MTRNALSIEAVGRWATYKGLLSRSIQAWDNDSRFNEVTDGNDVIKDKYPSTLEQQGKTT